jgi:hypothetical protein
MSVVFINRRRAGEIFHTYSTYGRGGEEFRGAYKYLDMTPKGRDEIGWVKRCPNPHNEGGEIEIHRLLEADDFGAEFTPELREHEEQLGAYAEQLATKR